MKNKNIILAVTGGIAAYKSATLIGKLRKEGANVYVIMTKNATNFITPLTLSTLSSHPVDVDTFERVANFDVEHISLAKKADLFVVAPASANVIGKVASGIADDMLTTTIMATTAPKVFAPAMNTNMYNNPIYKANEQKLKDYGYKFINPQKGMLACGDIGAGKLARVEDIVNYIKNILKES